MNKNNAYKFYFKDTSFFSELYNSIKCFTNMQTFSEGNVFVTKQQLYHGVPNEYKDDRLLVSLGGGLEAYRHLLTTSLVKKDKYLPQYKVLQLMKFLNPSACKEIEIYVDIAISLSDKSIIFQNGFCHGDLWKENILLNEDEKTVMIDFDKAIYFCLSYDYVYFYLMRSVLNKRICLEKILLNIDYYSNLIHQFFEKKCKAKVSSISWEEIRLCIYLFVLLKLTEQDLRQNKYGDSIGILQNTLNSI
ncbi:MAG: phosphotransferase [Pseudomonadota bacterium]